jgi:hypothetical protein
MWQQELLYLNPNQQKNQFMNKLRIQWAALLLFSMSSMLVTAAELLPVKIGDQYGFIDTKGKVVIEAVYEDADYFSEGLARVKTEGKYGYIDEKGKMVIKAIYGPKSGSFHEGFCRVEDPESGKVGFINKKGEGIIAQSYDDAGDFSEGMVAILRGRHWAYFDKSGAMKIKWQFAEAGAFHNGYARVNINKIYGFIDQEGLYAIIPDVDYVMASEQIVDNLAGIYLKGKGWGFFNADNEQVLDFKYRNTKHALPLVSEGLINVMDPETKKYGYIDTEGNMKIKPAYDLAHPFHHGLAAVQKGEEWGFIDPSGKLVIEFMDVEEVMHFTEAGVCAVKKNGNWNSYLNKSGKLFWNDGKMEK